MTTSGTDAIAVIIEEPSPAELAPVILMAYGLTKQERVLTALVCRGLSTSAIAARLHITPNNPARAIPAEGDGQQPDRALRLFHAMA